MQLSRMQRQMLFIALKNKRRNCFYVHAKINHYNYFFWISIFWGRKTKFRLVSIQEFRIST